MWKVLALILIASSAYAQTGIRCGQAPNLACASGTPSTQDVSTQFNFQGATPFTLEGATPDAFEINVAVTDPTVSDKTFTIPNADSAAATATGLPCSAGNHISNFNATTGVFTCSADSGSGGRWDQITAPTTSNLTLSMGNFVTAFTWGTTTGAATNMFDLRDTTANTGTGHVLAVATIGTSAAKPLIVTAAGTTNGVEMSTTGVLQKIGTGSIVADNLVFGSDAQGDIALRGASAYGRLVIGGNNTVLHSNGTTASWQSLGSGDIGPGDLANALTWNESCATSPCTLAAAPRTADSALVFWRTLKLRRVASCGGINEYTLASTTLTLCDSTGIGAGADSLQVTYEL